MSAPLCEQNSQEAGRGWVARVGLSPSCKFQSTPRILKLSFLFSLFRLYPVKIFPFYWSYNDFSPRFKRIINYGAARGKRQMRDCIKVEFKTNKLALLSGGRAEH